jgi:hypothetical protein
MKFELPNNINIQNYKKQVDKILHMMGHPEALVTDESIIWDFVPNTLSKRGGKQWLSHIEKSFGLPVELNDYIWEVAKKIHDLETNNDI